MFVESGAADGGGKSSSSAAAASSKKSAKKSSKDDNKPIPEPAERKTKPVQQVLCDFDELQDGQ